MPEISAIENLCSQKMWAKVHQNRLRPATPSDLHHAKFHRDRSNQLGETRYNFFTPFNILVPQGDPLDQGSHIPPLATWKISSSFDDPSPRCLLPKLVDFVTGMTHNKLTVNDCLRITMRRQKCMD